MLKRVRRSIVADFDWFMEVTCVKTDWNRFFLRVNYTFPFGLILLGIILASLYNLLQYFVWSRVQYPKRLYVSVLRSNRLLESINLIIPMLNLIKIAIFRVYYTFPFDLILFLQYVGISSQSFIVTCFDKNRWWSSISEMHIQCIELERNGEKRKYQV